MVNTTREHVCPRGQDRYKRHWQLIRTCESDFTGFKVGWAENNVIVQIRERISPNQNLKMIRIILCFGGGGAKHWNIWIIEWLGCCNSVLAIIQGFKNFWKSFLRESDIIKMHGWREPFSEIQWFLWQIRRGLIKISNVMENHLSWWMYH